MLKVLLKLLKFMIKQIPKTDMKLTNPWYKSICFSMVRGAKDDSLLDLL